MGGPCSLHIVGGGRIGHAVTRAAVRIAISNYHHQCFKGKAPYKPLGRRKTREKSLRTTWTHGTLDDVGVVSRISQLQPFVGTDFCFLQFDGGAMGKLKEICCYRGGDSKMVAGFTHWVLFDKRM